MTLTLIAQPEKASRAIYVCKEGSALPTELTKAQAAFAANFGFSGKAGEKLMLSEANGAIDAMLFGCGSDNTDPDIFGLLPKQLTKGAWHIAQSRPLTLNEAVALRLGAYEFTRYRKPNLPDISIAMHDQKLVDEAERIGQAACFTRDLVNTPTNDLLPSDLETVAKKLAKTHKAKISVITGDALLKKNFPMIHAVGRASADAPRLIDMSWGDPKHPKLTLVGKGVCFDSGGLDIKPASGMLIMKKDMGGAAHVLGLAQMIMQAGYRVRLRVLIPAVENAISANAFRPGDVLQSRKGLTVEIGNTDAEGRLVLADALTLASEENPDLIIDMATLTGAARVALGQDIPPFFSTSDELSNDVMMASKKRADPVWPLPLHQPYAKLLASKTADISNVGGGGFAGSITAALFMQHFVGPDISWMHFDVYAWTQNPKNTCPVGGEAHAIRALDAFISARYGK